MSDTLEAELTELIMGETLSPPAVERLVNLLCAAGQCKPSLQIEKQERELEMWRSMGRQFIRKVEAGKARSTHTYNAMKQILGDVSANLPLMEAVMDLQFCLQAMIKVGAHSEGEDRVKYLLSDEFASAVGEAEMAQQELHK